MTSLYEGRNDPCVTVSTGPPIAARPSVSTACSISSRRRSEEHTSELQSLMRISYAVFCLKKKKKNKNTYKTITKNLTTNKYNKTRNINSNTRNIKNTTHI